MAILSMKYKPQKLRITLHFRPYFLVSCQITQNLIQQSSQRKEIQLFSKNDRTHFLLDKKEQYNFLSFLKRNVRFLHINDYTFLMEQPSYYATFIGLNTSQLRT